MKNGESVYKDLLNISDNFFLIKEILHSQLSLIEELSGILSSELQIDNVSIILLSVITDYSNQGGAIPITDIINLVRFENCKSHLLHKSINELVDKNFLKKNLSEDTGEITYSLTEEFEKFIGKNLQ